LTSNPAVTAVVGANESGKSHLIEAVKQGLTGDGIDRGDFCRYSSLFSVETGRVRLPDFGVEVEADTEEDAAALAGVADGLRRGERVTLIRFGDGCNVMLDSSGGAKPLDKKQLASVQRALPVPFELATNVPLPDSIRLMSCWVASRTSWRSVGAGTT
jgi:hypothetical protein